MDAQSQDDKKWETFRQQIRDDISQIQDIVSWDTRTKEESFAFNYWILSRLYDEDESAAYNQITDYNDNGIDCFVHDEEGKHLYIIQNKYYSEGVKLGRGDLADFLKSPLASLMAGTYKRSEKLQKAFNKAQGDDKYTIHLHLYVTNNDDLSKGCENLMNAEKNEQFKFKLFSLKDIYELYYGQSFKKQVRLTYIFNTVNSRTYMAIRPKDYQLEDMCQTFFVMAPLTDIYKLWKDARDKEYSLFEENIREYLGKRTSVNKGAIKTLEDESDRKNFFYYNNGITIVCDDVNQVKNMKAGSIRVKQPQIINGCQTVNSIVEVLGSRSPEQMEEEFGKIFVMAKILSTNEMKFSNNVVNYTNSQNKIDEKVLAVGREKKFDRLQKEIEKYGFLLVVRQSDTNSFKEKYKDDKLRQQLHKANEYSSEIGLSITTLGELQVTLTRLLQCLGAVSKDAHFAYTKTADILKPNSTTYETFSVNVQDQFTVDDMVKVVCLYKKSEKDRKQGKKEGTDGRFPLAYYLLNFFGYLLKYHSSNGLKHLRNLDMSEIQALYEFIMPLSEAYYDELNTSDEIDYGKMLKTKIDENKFEKVLNSGLKSLNNYSKDKYEEIKHILDKT